MSLWSRSGVARKLFAVVAIQFTLVIVVFVVVGWLVRGLPRGLGGPGMIKPVPEHGVTPFNTIWVGATVIFGVGSFLTARWILAPLQRLARAAKAIGEGDLRARSGVVQKDEIGDLARTFDEMAERIERLVLAEKELLANVSHELRTPLARIRVALDIADETDAEMGRRSLAEIGQDLAELETLIEDILTTTRLEIAQGPSRAAGFELHLEETSPAAVCHGAAERFRGRHPLRRLEVVVEGGLSTFEVDPVLFRRVLDNLLENAHKYTPDGASPITLRAARAAGAVAITVEDRGMGIAAADRPRIFTPFFRADRSRTRGTGGVGLGLTLAKRIVEAHGGTIDVESVLDRGSTFRAVVPFMQERAPRNGG